MRPYETILSKVSPTFYKSLQYKEYFGESHKSVYSYLVYAKLPEAYTLYLPIKSIYYTVERDLSYPFEGKTESRKLITLTPINMNAQALYYVDTYVELIINMIINNFSFENVLFDQHLKFAEELNNIFIALVGRDIYETIRANIK